MADFAPALTVGVGVDADATVRLTAHCGSDVEADDPGVRLALETLACAAISGGFAVRPGACALELLRCEAEGARGIRWTLRLDNCDPRVFEVLREWLCRELAGGLSCRALDVVPASDDQPARRVIGWPTEITDFDAYPGLTKAAALFWMGGSENLSKSRRLIVEQRDPVTPERVAAVASTIAPWVRLLESGGYAMPVGHPSETESIFGEVCQYTEHEIEISVDRFMASESAWNTLFNMLTAASTEEQTLVRIELD